MRADVESLAMRWLAVLALALGACSGGTSTADPPTTIRDKPTTTTETAVGLPASCPATFDIPVQTVRDECSPYYMAAVADKQGVTLTDDAEAQATALCREIGIAGLIEAYALAFLAWDEGSRPSPAVNRESFVALAIGVYCPEFFDDLTTLND